jgi:hypothetical protein
MRRFFLRGLVGAWVGALSACGGASGGSDAVESDSLEPIPHQVPPQVSRLDDLAPAEFEVLAGQQAPLGQALQRARGLAGAGVVVYAGVLEDELSTRVTFAEVAGATGLVAVAWVCAGDKCRALVASPSPTGEPAFTDAAGAPAGAPALAAPAMQMILPGKSFDDPASVLTGALQADDFPVVDVTAARFVLASAWGAAFDLDLAPVLQAAEASGRYDDVELHPYVSAATLDLLLSELKEGDVLVWVGAGVSMRATSQGQTKTVGLTAARAVFGDEVVHVGRVRQLLDGNPFRDLALPSLVVLAGGRTWGDGAWDPLTDDDQVSPDSLVRNLQVGEHAVVAVAGDLDARSLEDSLGALFDGLFAGQRLDQAVASASQRLQRRGFTTTWKSLPEASALVLPDPVDDYWAATPLKKAPSFAELNLHVALTYTCLAAGSGVPYTPDALEDMVQNLYVREITAFDGPVFTKDWTYESKGENVNLQGRLGALANGTRFVLAVRGDLSDRMLDAQLYGLARVLEVVSGENDKGSYLEVRFTGNVSASTFKFSNGETCRLNASDTTSEAMSLNSEPSWLRLYR